MLFDVEGDCGVFLDQTDGLDYIRIGLNRIG